MDRTILSFLKEAVLSHGDNPLLKDGDRYLTIKELDEKSNQFANYLIERINPKENGRILLLMDPSAEAMVSIFTSLKLKMVYVPVNPKMVIANVRYIIEETEPEIIIYDEHYKDVIEKVGIMNSDRRIHLIKSCGLMVFEDFLLRGEITLRYKRSVLSNDIVYIIYTSGSTGAPKGVMISHKCIHSFTTYVIKRFNHCSNNISLSMSHLSFDPFLTEILPSIIGGGLVVLYKGALTLRSLLKLIEKEKIQVMGCGPTLLKLLYNNIEYLKKHNLSKLREIYFGYEHCPVDIIRTLQIAMPTTDFINGYGTTETFACSTFYVVPKLDGVEIDALPVGGTIEGTEIILLNENGEVVNGEGVGRAAIRGETIMNGYWRRDEETTSCMIDLPTFKESNEKVFLTADILKRDSDQNYIFVTRLDDQVKLNGYRVELLEVQKRIENIDGVAECCVAMVERNHHNQLICFLSLGSLNAKVEKIMEASNYFLEEYKQPKEWIVVDALPKNANSKVDRKVLLDMYNSGVWSN